MENISAALNVCKCLGVDESSFYQLISTFKGAAKRLQLVKSGETTDVFLDFAHAPSKVLATVKAVRENYPFRKLVACLELHTFSSLNPNFLDQYANTLNEATFPIVFYNPKTLEHKKMPPLDTEMVKQKFNNENLKVFVDSQELYQHLSSHFWDNTNLLLMSSGNFAGLNITQLADAITDDDSFPRRYLDI
jgi:UDP-N-acetylmuramate: L-alanyl-gamma-D-glutamyl-meso-diaminopimelate ligase